MTVWESPWWLDDGVAAVDLGEGGWKEKPEDIERYLLTTASRHSKARAMRDLRARISLLMVGCVTGSRGSTSTRIQLMEGVLCQH